jgi:hypothetical protein
MSAASASATRSRAANTYMLMTLSLMNSDAHRALERLCSIGWVMHARNDHCRALYLDSGMQRHHAHRFYLRERMEIVSYHFRSESLADDKEVTEILTSRLKAKPNIAQNVRPNNSQDHTFRLPPLLPKIVT